MSSRSRSPTRRPAQADAAGDPQRGRIARTTAGGKRDQGENPARAGEFLELDEVPQRIEVYDNSHIQGSKAVGAMVVASPEGFEKGQYRKFNIKSAQTNDDFGMMREVMGRRFRNLSEHPEGEEGKKGSHETVWPDLVLIDGGKGQMSSVRDTLEMGIERVPLIAIARGRITGARAAKCSIFPTVAKTLPVNSPCFSTFRPLRRGAPLRHRRPSRQAEPGDYGQPLDEIPGIGPPVSARFAAFRHSGRSARQLWKTCNGRLESAKGGRQIYDFYHTGG